MKQSLRFVELKSGFSDDGPAWIGYATFSKSGRSVYFDGKILKRGSGISGNYFDLRTGEEYWVSGVKKNGSDRHWAGNGSIGIDVTAVEAYLQIIGSTALPRWLHVVELNNEPNKALAADLENREAEAKFDEALRFRPIAELTNEQIRSVVQYYESIDMPSVHKKARKEFIATMDELRSELDRRNS